MRSDAAHAVNQKCRIEIFGDLLKLDQSELDQKLGWKDARGRQKGGWQIYDVEVLNSSNYAGKWSPKTIFRSNYLYRVRSCSLSVIATHLIFVHPRLQPLFFTAVLLSWTLSQTDHSLLQILTAHTRPCGISQQLPLSLLLHAQSL